VNFNLNFGNLAGSLRGIWEELVEHRLWPVAIALAVALVAVPVLLSNSAPKQTSAPVTPGGTGNLAAPIAAFEPAVSTEGKKSSEIRKNLKHFKAKNPFTPQGVNFSSGNAAGTATPVGTTDAGGTATVPSGSSGAGSTSGYVPPTSGSSDSSTGSTGSTGSSGSPKTTYYTYTVDVRFGKTDQLDSKTLTSFRALPSSDDPIIVFMGVRKDGETAVFLVGANATSTGDGTCSPSEDECTFLAMKAGDKRTIEAVGQNNEVTDYQLVLQDVNVKKTTGPDHAQSSGERAASRMQTRSNFKRAIRSFEQLGF
jgi:hypothetical protein